MKVQFNNIPEGIRGKPLYCLAKLEQKPGKNKPDKIPYQITGARASPNNQGHFKSLAEIEDIFKKGGYDAIGIGVFDSMVVIDIDKCVSNGKLNKFARKIVNKLKSYTEISISGTGIHIVAFASGLVFDKDRYYFNNRKLGLEIYPAGFTKRFIMLTGNIVNTYDVVECTDAVQWVFDTYMVKPNADMKVTVNAPGSYLSDETILAKMFTSANGEKTKALWNGGNDGKSASEGDLALCNILAFWCGGDAEQMDRLFRSSSRIRDKWDEVHGAETYGNITIKKAIKSCKEFYKPFGKTVAAEDFNELVSVLIELKPESNPRYKHGDLGKGRLFADVFKDIARYVPERRKWYIYDGIRWVADVGSLKAMELAKNLADAITIYSTTIKDEATREFFTNDFVKKWIQRGMRTTYISDAESVYPVPMKKFDSDIYLFNVRNGTIDLKDRSFREHRPEDFITKLSPVDYMPLARSERFLQFVDEITSGDTDKAKYLQKSLGYSLTGDTRFECMFFLYGETTRNGKGTLMESVLLVCGDYGTTVRPETIALKSNANSQSPSEDIARLAGIRFANISEPSRGLLLNAAQVKNMTGNDTLNARFLHENSFDFKPQFKLYVNTNYLPVIIDMTVFTSNRVLIIPFDRHFEEWEQDKTLKAEFKKPEVQSAILNWLLDGYDLLMDEGFKPPQSVIEATANYCHESDKISQFAEEKLIEDETAEVRTSAVYEHYKHWCDDNGCYSENSRNFNQELRKFGNVVRKRPQTGGEKTTMLIGYRMKDVVTDFLN